CIVVDDGSTDDTADVALEFGAKLLSTGAQSGPAKARNLGAKQAEGEILFFLDADVCVHEDTLQRVAAAFGADPELDAVIGSYDAEPGSGDFLSQYKNLMHAFVHRQARHDASTFWSGCGAIRKDVFHEFGGFDESYVRPSIEDIELGYRLHEADRKLALDRRIQVKHLKRWTFWGLVKTDIFSRGIPWTELILRDRHMPNDLNVQLSQRVSVALVFLLSGMSLFAAVWWQGYFLVPLFAVLFLVLGRFWVEHADFHERKAGVIWTTAIVSIIVFTAYLYEMSVLIPPLLLGFVLLLSRHRYEHQSPAWLYNSVLVGASTLTLVVFAMFYIPFHWFVFWVIVVFLAVVLLNTQFYLFLAEKRAGLSRSRPFRFTCCITSTTASRLPPARCAISGGRAGCIPGGKRKLPGRRPRPEPGPRARTAEGRSLLEEKVPHKHGVDTGGVEAANGVARGADQRVSEEVERGVVEDGEPGGGAEGVEQAPVERVVFGADGVDTDAVRAQQRAFERLAMLVANAAHGGEEAGVGPDLEILGGHLFRHGSGKLAKRLAVLDEGVEVFG
ncbi:MAG: glycosyltransferase, partial [bacterium]|nr:glycosyltransferase [bacterium]